MFTRIYFSEIKDQLKQRKIIVAEYPSTTAWRSPMARAVVHKHNSKNETVDVLHGTVKPHVLYSFSSAREAQNFINEG